MGQQLPLPAGWALRFASGLDARDQMAAIAGYATDMLSDLFHEATGRLGHEIEAVDPVG